MNDNNSLSPEATVNDVICRFPDAIPVFNELGIDSCCGGAASLEVAAREAGIEAEVLLVALDDAIKAGVRS